MDNGRERFDSLCVFLLFSFLTLQANHTFGTKQRGSRVQLLIEQQKNCRHNKQLCRGRVFLHDDTEQLSFVHQWLIICMCTVVLFSTILMIFQ